MTDKTQKKMSLGFDEKITESNFPSCERKFLDASGQFKAAGKAIATGERPKFELLLPRESYQYTYLDDNGERQTIRKKWNTAAQRTLDEVNRRIVEREKEYKTDCGTLWILLIHAISKAVMESLKANHKTELDAARENHDTFELWSLIKKTCQGLARTKVRNLEDAYNAVRQGTYSFVAFAAHHRDKMEALIMAGRVLTDREKALHLVDRCNATELKDGCPKVYSENREGDTYPSYMDIIQAMQLHNLNISQNTEANKGKPKDAKPAQEDKKRKREEEPKVDDGYVKVLAAKLESVFKEKYNWTESASGKKKSKVEDKPAEAKGSGAPVKTLSPSQLAALENCLCWNCKLKGHLTHKCTKTKTKCTKCGVSGHHSEFCEPATAALERYAASKKSRKVAHGKSVRVLLDEVDDEVAEPEDAVEHKAAAARVVKDRPDIGKTHTVGNYIAALTGARAFAIKVIEDTDTIEIVDSTPENTQTSGDGQRGSDTNGNSQDASFEGEAPEVVEMLASSADTSRNQEASSEGSSSSGSSGSSESVSSSSSSGSSEGDEEDDLGDGGDIGAGGNEEDSTLLTLHSARYSSPSADPRSATEEEGTLVGSVVSRVQCNLEEGEEQEHNAGHNSDDSVQLVEDPALTRAKPAPTFDRASVARSTSGQPKSTLTEAQQTAKYKQAIRTSTVPLPILPLGIERKGVQGKQYKEPRKDNEHESSPESVSEVYFSDARSHFVGLPERPANPEDIQREADACRRHLSTNWDNLGEAFRRVIACADSIRYQETLLSMLNVQPDKSGIPVSIKSAQKKISGLYQSYCGNPRGERQTYFRVRPLDDIEGAQTKKKLGELWTALVMRQSDLRATAASLDKCFESKEALHFWQNLTGTLNPVLPPNILTLGTVADKHLVPEVGRIRLNDEPDTPEDQQLVNLFTTDLADLKHLHPIHAHPVRPLGGPNTESDRLIIESEREQAGAIWREQRKKVREEGLSAFLVREEGAAKTALKLRKGDESDAEGATRGVQKAIAKKPAVELEEDASGPVVMTPIAPKVKPPAIVTTSKPASRASSSASGTERVTRNGPSNGEVSTRDSPKASEPKEPENRAKLVVSTARIDPVFRNPPKGGERRPETQTQRHERTRQGERDGDDREVRGREHGGTKRRNPSPPRQHDESLKQRRLDTYGAPTGLTGTLEQRSSQRDDEDSYRSKQRSGSRSKRGKYSPQDQSQHDRDHGSHNGMSWNNTGDQGVRRRDDDRWRDDSSNTDRPRNRDQDRDRDRDRDRQRERERDRDHGRDRERDRTPNRQDPPRAPPIPAEVQVEDVLTVYYRRVVTTRIRDYGITLRTMLVGGTPLQVAENADGSPLSETYLLNVLRTIQNLPTSSTDQPRPVALIPRADILSLQQLGLPLIAEEQAHRAYAITTGLQPDGEGVVVDTGASVTLIRNTDGLTGYQQANRRRLTIQTASGHLITSEQVGTVPGLGTIAVSRAVSDNLLSVIQLCRNSSEVTLTFQGDHGLISHPMLLNPLIVSLVDDQYVLSQADFYALQEAIAGDGSHYALAANTMSEGSELESNPVPVLDQTITALDIENLVLSPIQMAQTAAEDTTGTDEAEATEQAEAPEETETQDAGTTETHQPILLSPEPGVQQFLHDTEIAVPLTPEQLRRAREGEM